MAEHVTNMSKKWYGVTLSGMPLSFENGWPIRACGLVTLGGPDQLQVARIEYNFRNNISD